MNTLFVGQSRIHLKAVGSTNSYASELMRQNAVSEGLLVTADEQQNGRGQRGNSWESEPNSNAVMSIVLYPKFIPAHRQFLLTQTVSLALADLMADLLGEDHDVKIKWPNDIYVDGRKIAGVLIENSLRENVISSSIVGIGLNVNQREFLSAPNAVSLAQLRSEMLNVNEVISRLCSRIEGRYLMLRAGKTDELENAYRENLYRLNMWSQFAFADGRFTGRIEGVDVEGRLLVQMQAGKKMTFNLKEIAFIP